ncbi:MAG: hypothetical protein WC586_06415 [Methanoregula sp.]
MQKIPGEKIPTLDPATDTLLFRSLRYNTDNGLKKERGVDLFVTSDAMNNAIFWFHHWTWCDTGPGICQLTSRDEAARFLREQFMTPGFFAGWNYLEIEKFFPEFYRKA